MYVTFITGVATRSLRLFLQQVSLSVACITFGDINAVTSVAYKAFRESEKNWFKPHSGFPTDLFKAAPLLQLFFVRCVHYENTPIQIY